MFLCLCAPSAAGAFPGQVDRTVGPLISGTSAYLAGTFEWTGYAYNDTTAYPSGVGANSANLIQLQLSHPSGGVRIRAILETLTNTSLPLLGVGFDTDRNAATGASGFPGGAWHTSGALGLEDYVAITASGGTLFRWEGGSWHKAGRFPVTADTESNSITATVPRKLLEPGVSTWNVVAALGLSGTNSWLAGSGSIYDLGFLHEEDCEEAAFAVCGPDAGATWQDGRQKKVLAGTEPASEAAGAVDFAKLAAKVTELPSASTAGFHTLLYHSNLNLGEGMPETTCIAGVDPCTLTGGPYQPYQVEVPTGLIGPTPMMFLMHGVTGNHLFTTDLPAPDAIHAVFAMPLGRGGSAGWGGGDATTGGPVESGAYGTADLDAVYEDITHRLPIDLNHVVIGGGSLGGLGAFRNSEFHPDRYAGAYSEVGGDCCIVATNHTEPRRLENDISVPIRMVNGLLDPLATPPAVAEFYGQADRLGDVEYLSFLLTKHSHDISSTGELEPFTGQITPIATCLMRRLLETPRVKDPARVVYVIDPNYDFSNPATGLNETHHGAYWVSGMQPSGTNEARIDVSTLTRPIRTTSGTPIAGANDNLSERRDLCGPNPEMETHDSWTEHGVALTPGPPQPTSNGAEMTLTRLSAATLDLGQMAINADQPITLTVGGDRLAKLTLTGALPAGRSYAVTRDGVPDGTIVSQSKALVLERDFTSAGADKEVPAWVGEEGVTVAGVDDYTTLEGAHTWVLTPQ